MNGGSGTSIRDASDARDAFDALARQLWEDGWEPMSLGRAWHDATYRRVVSEDRPAMP